MDEVAKEMELLAKMKAARFDPKNCNGYKWIIVNLQKQPNFEEIKVFCTGLSKLFKIPIYREYYRRKKSCIFWVEENLDQINKIVKNERVEFQVIGDKEDEAHIIRIRPLDYYNL